MNIRQMLEERNGEGDAEIIKQIKEKDLLKKNEGGAYKEELRKIEAQYRIDINLARQKMGMVFQHFNLFPHMTILKNMTIGPMKLQ